MGTAGSPVRSATHTIPERQRHRPRPYRAAAPIQGARSMSLNRRDTMGIGAALIVGTMIPVPAQACRLFPASSTDRYLGYQDGEEVGSQRFEFLRESGRFVVNSQIDIRYRNNARSPVPFLHRSTEVWERGWLNAFTATTRHSDREIEIEAHSVEHGILSVNSSVSDFTLQVSGYVVPTSLWHRDARLVNRLIDLHDGRVKLVKVYYAGKDVLPRDGGVAAASHYRVRGEIVRDAWYSEDCQLLRVQMPLPQAKPVTFELLPAIV